jgi:hypothetical protein
VEVVAGLSLKNLKPSVWDPKSPYHLSELRAVMVSYADFHQMPARRRKAMEHGLRDYLGVPVGVSVYLDNGAFYFLSKKGEVPRQEYEDFVRNARPDWYAIPQDYIPTPRMSDAEQLDCLRRTMEVNRAYQHDGYVPVVHISRHLDEYLRLFRNEDQLCAKPAVALGGIVPNLLRAPKAMSYENVLDKLHRVRKELADQQLHVFGIGGTATLHLATLVSIDSVDSSGWRNRAARGIVQLPGRGDRMVAELGSWRGRRPDAEEWEALKKCECPACQQFGLEGLKASRIHGFCNRATHNLWTLLEEVHCIQHHLSAGTYTQWYEQHLDNSIYLPLIGQVLTIRVIG